MAEENETTTGTKTNNPTTYTINGIIQAEEIYYKTNEGYKNYPKDSDLKNYVTKNELEKKQDILISGKTIKTINNKSILGEGNIEVAVQSGANIKDSETSTESTYSSSKIEEKLKSKLDGVNIISKNSSLIEISKYNDNSNNSIWTIKPNSNIITTNNNGDLLLDGSLSANKINAKEIESISENNLNPSIFFKNNNSKSLILKADNSSITEDLEITLPNKAGIVALLSDIPSTTTFTLEGTTLNIITN